MVEKCSYCGEEGHSIQQCPKWKRKEPFAEKLMARERSQPDAESAATTFRSAGYTCRVTPEIDINTRHPTGMWEVWCKKETVATATKEPIYYGEPSYLYGETVKRPDWLPIDVLKAFWLMNFARDESTRLDARNKLERAGVREVKGTVHIPLEAGRYGQIYSYGTVYFVPSITEKNTDKYIKFYSFESLGLSPQNSVYEKLPAHAKRAYSLSAVLPEPRYNISVDGTWIGEFKALEGYPWLGKVFFPTNWKTKEEAIQEAIALWKGRHPLPSYMGTKDMSKAIVDVVECFGSYPQDRATIWRNGLITYIYEA